MQLQVVLMAHPVHLLLALNHQPFLAHRQPMNELPGSATHMKRGNYSVTIQMGENNPISIHQLIQIITANIR